MNTAAIISAVSLAEAFAVEALVKIEEATQPGSDGGASITPKELRQIRPLIVKSATLDHEAGEMTGN